MQHHTDSRLALRLGVKRRLSRRNDPREHEAREAFDRRRMAVVDRDGWACRACGFASQRMSAARAPAGGMEVHHIDDDHHNNALSNLVTLCPFCHMSFTLGRRGARFDATLGYEPRYTQAEINLLHHTVWGLSRALELADDPRQSEGMKGWAEGAVTEAMAEAVGRASEALRQMREDAEQRLSASFIGDLEHIKELPALYAALQKLPPKAYAERERVIGGLRLLPRYAPFEAHIERWARYIWAAHYPPGTWADFLASVADYRDGSGEA